MDRLILRLKAIEYKYDFCDYLFFYFPDLSFQAIYFLTLFFKSHIFKTSYF